MKKILFLGSGDAFHSGGRGHSCYWIETQSKNNFLIDAGATALYRMQNSGLSTDSLDGILFTHFHGDHMSGLPFLLMEMDIVKKRTRPLYLAGPEGTGAEWIRWMELFYPGHKVRFPVETLHEGEGIFSFLSLDMKAVSVNHKPESIGYRIRTNTKKTVAFSGDTAFDDALFRLTDGAFLSVVELSMEKKPENPVAHISLEELRDGRRRLNTKHLILSHASPETAEAAENEGLGKAAFDGMEIDPEKDFS